MKNWKKNIILFLASQTLSLFGSMLIQYAITWYITLKTQSGIMMTIAIICGFLPMFFISPFAGVWADRYNRKILIMLADTGIAISTLILAVLFFMGYNEPWLLFVASGIRALGAGIQTPAVGAFIPQLVPSDRLTKINATNSTIQSVIMLIAPMISGAMMTLVPIQMIFFIDVITAAIAVLILFLFLHVSAHRKAVSNKEISYFSDMKKGFVYINAHKYLKRFFLFDAVFFILAAPAAFLTPLQVTRSFGNDIWRLTAVEITFSIGMMIGGIFMASWNGFKNKVHTMIMSTIVIGTCTFALGIIPVFWIYLLFMSLTGFAIPIFNTPATVLLQERVEGNFLGRVFGVSSMIASIMMPMGMLVFGPAADLVKIEWLLIGTGLIMVVQSSFMLKSKVMLEAGEPVIK